MRNYYQKYSPLFAEKSSRIVTVSEFTKQDIVSKYNIPSEKIDVIYNGVNSEYTPVSEDRKEKVKVEFTGGKDFFLYVGSIHPRKNIENLLKAFEEFKNENNSEVKLVLAGNKGWSNEEMQKYYEGMKHKHDVVFTGRVSTEQLNGLLGAAKALTYVFIFRRVRYSSH